MKKTSPASPPASPSTGSQKNSPSATEKTDSSSQADDVVLVHGVTEDRQGLRVLRARDQQVELGEVRPLAEGQPITSDVVRLRPRKETPYLCDVETAYSPSHSNQTKESMPTKSSSMQASSRLTHAGPAQVASPEYRENWDAIWATKITGRGSDELN